MNESKELIRCVLRAQVGDRSALNDVLSHIQVPLYRYLVKMVGDNSFAEDVLQEVFWVICRKISTVRQPEFFMHWCFRIASRKAFRLLPGERKWSRQVGQSVVLDTIAESNDTPDSPDVDNAELGHALEETSPASRAVLVLHYFSGFSLQETADILGINVGTVKSRLSYGLSTLRDRLG